MSIETVAADLHDEIVRAIELLNEDSDNGTLKSQIVLVAGHGSLFLSAETDNHGTMEVPFTGVESLAALAEEVANTMEDHGDSLNEDARMEFEGGLDTIRETASIASGDSVSDEWEGILDDIEAQVEELRRKMSRSDTFEEGNKFKEAAETLRSAVNTFEEAQRKVVEPAPLVLPVITAAPVAETNEVSAINPPNALATIDIYSDGDRPEYAGSDF